MTTDYIYLQPGDVGADYVALTTAIKSWLLANNARFVIRYLVPTETTKIGKVITGDEIQWLHEHGIAILLNHERSHNDASHGYQRGRMYGTTMRDQLRELDYPIGCPAFVSVDTDTTETNKVVHYAYLSGFADAVLPWGIGVYGDDDIALAKVADYFWLANAMAWSRPLNSYITVHIRQGPQNKSIGIDPNYVVTPTPAWLPAKYQPVIPVTTYPTIIDGEEMPIFVYAPSNYANTFAVFASGLVIPLTPSLFNTWVASGVTVVTEVHEQLLHSLLTQAGLTVQHLVPK